MNANTPARSLLLIVPLLAGLLATPAGRAAEGSGLFERSAMRETDLTGLKIRVGRPVQVTAQLSWETRWLGEDGQPVWAFAHFFPTIVAFPKGNLIATYAMDPDRQDNPLFANGYQISGDGGRTWGRRMSVIMQHNPMVYVPRDADTLLGIPCELMRASPQDERNFVGPACYFESGGSRLVMVPDGVRVVDWPWPVEVTPSPQPSENWHVGICITGSVLKSGDSTLATVYGRRMGDKVLRTMLVASKDGGLTWRYYATVAAGDPALAGKKGYEGANEPALIRLANGELMEVFRQGSGRAWNLLRSYSRDEGLTWSAPDVLPAFSVKPALVRTANGTIVLATGRPGIDLWVSTDGRGTSWQRLDLIAQHNAWTEDPFLRISSTESGQGIKWQTTSYTQMVEVAPNRLLLIYERDAVTRPPEAAPKSPKDLSRVFVMPIQIGPN